MTLRLGAPLPQDPDPSLDRRAFVLQRIIEESADTSGARAALEGAGIRVVDDREVIDLKLRQEVPGQLGTITRRMATAGVNIEVQYSDHDHNLVLVVDDPVRGREVAERWRHETRDSQPA